MTGRIRLATLTAAALLTVAGCIPPRPSPSSTAAPPSSAPPSVASPSATASAGTAPSADASTEPSAGVAVDPSLLGVLPDTVGGVPLQADETTAAEIAREPSIAPFVSSLAIAAAFGPPASGSVGDYVVVTVARVKPGLFGDLFFRGWRDTFDTAVCQQAGGVQGAAEATIGGRQTFIGTCAGGIHTYHVHLPQQDLIVSMQGGGPKRFGERVVEGLNE
ncbi:MAG TPA: hypothetical protein VFN41_04170 [Candidatus Limnocylindrales bacterium]|nr:hypothetical protein [Candidatus Limnocylindrales bacterium]